MSDTPLKSPRRLLGIDFSVDSKKAAYYSWLTSVDVSSTGAPISVSCQPLAALLPQGKLSREAAMEGLVRYLSRQNNVFVGLDAAFSLPLATMETVTDWRSWVTTFSTVDKTPEAFRASCQEKAQKKEVKRHTDKLAKTPFSPYNLRLYRQTYYACSLVVAPLLSTKQYAIYPFDKLSDDKNWLAEICPASTLKALGLYLTGYKQKSEAGKQARQHIIKLLAERYELPLSAETEQQLVDNHGGDALDSLVAAVALLQAIQNPELLNGDRLPREARQVEGWVLGFLPVSE